MLQLQTSTPPHSRAPRAFGAGGPLALCLALFAASASAGYEEPPTPQPLPIPAPLIGSDDPVRSATSSSAGWIAVADTEGDEREAAEMLRQWAASTAPALPPFEERLPGGAVKLHHNGHFLSTLYATIDEEGRLLYSHQPPSEPRGEIEPSPPGDGPASVSAAPNGGAQ